MMNDQPRSARRFLRLADVATVLNVSTDQAYALVRSGELPAIKVGGRGYWRVEAEALESYVQRMYDETRQFVASHPVGSDHETAGELSTGGADLS